MKILLLTNLPPEPGGLEVFTSGLTRALGDEIDFVIAGLKQHGRMPRGGPGQFVLPHKGQVRTLERVDIWPGRHVVAWRWISSLRRLSAFVEDVAPDAILCQSTDFIHFYLAILQLTRRLAPPIAYAFHIPLAEITFQHPPHRRRLLRAAVARARVNLAVSQGLADEVQRELSLPVDKIRTLYNPIPIERIRALSQEEVTDLPFGDELPFVVHVGRIDTNHKNQVMLVRAFERVLERVEARLVLIGGGQPDAELARLLESPRLLGRVHLLGWRDNPFKYMRRAHALALSSNFEGFGLVLAEALACGCPVIATDCQFGPAEVLDGGACGLLTPVGDAASMADGLVRLLTDGDLRASLAARGMRRVEAFAAERVYAEYRQLFYSLAGRAPAP